MRQKRGSRPLLAAIEESGEVVVIFQSVDAHVLNNPQKLNPIKPEVPEVLPRFFEVVAGDGIEPPTQGFQVFLKVFWTIPDINGQNSQLISINKGYYACPLLGNLRLV